jgi:anhydro-N-acetylmuramic acid kinase
MSLYIGLMSGTSLDGVDGVLAEFADDAGPLPRLLAHRQAGLDSALRAELLRLNRSGPDELHVAALSANALMRAYARVVGDLLQACGIGRDAVRAIGAHGQTVRHRPQQFDGCGYTLQLVNGALLAELCGIDVVCDFRSRDLAAGGQGAPLVPALHAALFGRPGRDLAVLNLGGIANLTLLHADGRVEGFDTGPANALLDLWCQRHRGQPFDADGRFAASGRVDEALLGRLLAEPYFGRAPPKSTGRDLFDADWLDRHLMGVSRAVPAENVQATLAELTARSVAAALLRQAPRTDQLLVCGGGAANADLMQRLRAQLPDIGVEPTGTRGVPPQQVEALAFAWLARALVERQAGNVPSVTGARGPRILGALYPAG